MKKFLWFAGITSFLWILVLGQPVLGVRYCAFGKGVMTNNDRANLAGEEILRYYDQRYSEKKYYHKVRDELALIVENHKKCIFNKYISECNSILIDNNRNYSWLYSKRSFLDDEAYDISYSNNKYIDIGIYVFIPDCHDRDVFNEGFMTLQFKNKGDEE